MDQVGQNTQVWKHHLFIWVNQSKILFSQTTAGNGSSGTRGAPEEPHQRKAGECKGLILQPSKVQLAQKMNILEPAFQGCDTK